MQDFLISYSYWRDILPIKNVFIPLFYDDTRENSGINNGFYPQLVKENFRFTNDIDLLNKLNKRLSLLKENLEDTANLELSTQDRSELFLNEFLYNNWNSVWGRRKDAQGYIFSNLYLLRNTLFNISPSSIRRKIPERYLNNMLALDLIINESISNDISIFLYIPPIRNDVQIPYDLEDYNLFINEAKNLSNKSDFVHFKDFSSIVPASSFGLKESTSLTGEDKEYDFMHFTFQGHKILADSLINFSTINKTK